MSVLVHPRDVAPRPPARPRVALWWVPIDVDDTTLTSAERCITQAERAYADRGTTSVRRRRIALRAGLRTVLGALLCTRAEEVPLRTTATGRLELDLPGTELDISCSTAGRHGLVAVARGVRIGVDLERVVPWSDETANEGWLTAEEIARIRALPSTRRDRAATLCWTRKEAVLKAMGTGLLASPLSVSPCIGPRRVADWTWTPVRVPAGLVATIASSSPFPRWVRVLTPRPLPADEEANR